MAKFVNANHPFRSMNTTEKLLADIESALGKTIETPKDFELLSEQILSRTGEPLSTSTLKRMWGYLPSDTTPSLHTMNVLSRFLGYRSWKHFLSESSDEEQQSDPVISRHLIVEEELCVGDRLRLTWHPGRVCDVEYLGGSQFKVLESQNTRIQAGNTFRCSMIIENGPLYIDHLCQEGMQYAAYICGKKTGVRFERIYS